MSKWLTVFALVMVCATATAQTSKGVTLYVAPDGNDAWSGKLASPNRRKDDGPFATLQRARDAVRELKRQQGGTLKQPVTVFVRGGTYFLTEPLVFTPEDSGGANAPVTYAAYQKEKPVISGGRRISGNWKWGELRDGRQVWTAQIPDVREGKWFFRQLWVNGQRRTRARHPNKGYLSVVEPLDVTPQSQWTDGQTRFRFKEGDLKAWSTVADADVVVMNRWVESHIPITSVDEKERIVACGKRSVFKLDPSDPYYVEHAMELLDEPGEWYLARKSGTLYYMSLPGEDVNKTELVAPVIAQVVRLQGEPQVGQWVENLIFRGLTFAHTEWWFPRGSEPQWPKPDVGGFAQAAVGVPGAIWGEGVRKCSWEGCAIAHIGDYAIELARGCASNRVIGCEIFDLGAGGVRIGETAIRENEAEQTHDNEVSDCHIYDGGRIFHSAIGVWVGQSPNNRFTHNHVHDFYYSGFSIGWTWGYGKALATGNLVEFNHVHHIGVQSDGDGPILSDMGGIYTLGNQTGTMIRNNLWHDIAGLRYGGWGIYFDEGTTGILAENNVVYRTTHGGFHQHYGKDNIVRNNVFAFARDHQVQATRPEPHTRFAFEGNIVYWREGQTIAGNFSDFHFAFDRNLYWREGGGEIKFGNLTLEQWREKGMDKNSQIADPLFADVQKDDFTLKPDSPALKMGFKPIDLKGVGVRVR
jgi:hypothetical protein